MTRVAFLPGAGGRSAFWMPVAERLGLSEGALLFGWPGFGDEPHAPRIQRLSDLAAYCVERLDGPTDLVTQSMGGVVAIQIALERPDLVRRLVLCGTSGGIDLSRFDAEDWRPGYAASFEQVPRWFVDDRTDLSRQIPAVRAPVLLLWGSEDRVSPPAAGRYLATLLADSQFVTVAGGTHAVAAEKPDEVAGHIARFLGIEVAA